jgi:ABC-type transport system substrate-binding protein
MTIRTIGGVVLVAALGVSAAACAGDDGEGGTTPSSTTPSATTPATTTPSTASTTAPDTTEPSAAPESRFSISISEPAAIDPAMAQEVEGAQVTRLLFQTLVALDPELALVPGAASSWSVADDGVTWTFELRPDATFSDGSAVDAGDFVFAFARSADPDLAAPAAYQGLPIAGWGDVLGAEPSGTVGDVPVSGVRAVDEDTLEIVTAEPFSLLPKLLTYPVFAPVPTELFDDSGASATFADAPVGNGPYMMAEPWQHNESPGTRHTGVSRARPRRSSSASTPTRPPPSGTPRPGSSTSRAVSPVSCSRASVPSSATGSRRSPSPPSPTSGCPRLSSPSTTSTSARPSHWRSTATPSASACCRA